MKPNTLACTACAGLALVASFAFGTGAAAQATERCDLIFDPNPTTSLNRIATGTGDFIVYVGGGVIARCRGQNNRLVSDSAEYYEARGLLYLFGNVRYTEPRVRVDAERMTYFQNEERLNAQGNVFITFTNGSTMRGPVADYYRIMPGRPQEQLVGTGRPQLSLIERDPTGRAEPPVIVFANRIRMDGDSLIYASGRVEITRTDVTAVGDSAYMDGGNEFVRLMRQPRVTGRGDRPFTLEGRVIDLFSRNRHLERVVASPQGHATSQDLELFADSLDLRIREDRLERAYAWGPSRARATSPERDVTADSLDVILPAQRLEEFRAVGGAFATSIPDTARVISDERDWMQGDTIIALFDSLTVGDTRRVQTREVVAVGSARSYHQMQPQGEGAAERRDRPNVNYVRGDRIRVELREGEVQSVTVVGNASGVYLEREENVSGAAPGRTPVPPTVPRR